MTVFGLPLHPLIGQLPTGLPQLPVLVLVIVVIGAAGAMVQVVRIGHSGAQAAWSDVA